MKKFTLLLCAVAGFAVLGGTTVKADRGEEDYEPAPRARREYREYREHDHDECRRVYIIENDRPVRRAVYFDDSGRCYYPAGPRRVYVETYYREYPRFYRPYRHTYHGGERFYDHRPRFSAAISF